MDTRVTVTLGGTELREAVIGLRRRALARYFYWLMLLPLLPPLLLVFTYHGSLLARLGVLGVVLATIIAFLLIVRGVRALMISWDVRIWTRYLGRPPVQLDLDFRDENLRIFSRGATTTVPQASLRVTELKNLWLIFTAPQTFLILPKAQVPDAAREQILGLRPAEKVTGNLAFPVPLVANQATGPEPEAVPKTSAPAADEALEFEVLLTPKHLSEGQDAMWRVVFGRWRYLLLMFVLIPLVALPVFAVRSMLHDGSFGVVFWSIVIGGTVVLTSVSWWKQRKQKSRAVPQRIRYRLTGGGIEVHGDGVDLDIAWEHFKALHRAKTVWVLLRKDRVVQIVPADQLSEAAQAFILSRVRASGGRISP